jgi:hypothetical protein
MDHTERIARIGELKSAILPLREEKQILQLKIYFKKSNAEENLRLEQIDELLRPLVTELEGKLARYFVSYKGELTNVQTNVRYWSEPVVEIVNLSSFCDIRQLDEQAMGLDGFISLINEITEFLYITRFSRFEIINIQRVLS